MIHFHWSRNMPALLTPKNDSRLASAARKRTLRESKFVGLE